jgi:hypothetical protein
MVATLNTSTKSHAELMLVLNGLAGLRLFTADEYQRLADVGVLGEDDRVEPIEGDC